MASSRAGVGPDPPDGAHGADGSHRVPVVERGGFVVVAAVGAGVRLAQDPGQLTGEHQAGAVVDHGRFERAHLVPPRCLRHVHARPFVIRASSS